MPAPLIFVGVSGGQPTTLVDFDTEIAVSSERAQGLLDVPPSRQRVKIRREPDRINVVSRRALGLTA